MPRLGLPPLTQRSWWWGFGLFIAMPAVALALLGIRAARAADVEQARQVGDEQRQVASLVDAALDTALDRLTADAIADYAAATAPATTDRDVIPFAIDSNGVVAFPRDRVFFGPLGHLPAVSDWRPPTPDIVALIDEAQTLEAQGRREEARTRLERAGSAEASLADWVGLRLLTEQAAAGDATAIARLSDARQAASTSRGPSGAPIAVVASAMSAVVPAKSRAAFRSLATRTADELRAGRWWLAVDQRRAYAAELARTLVAVGGQPIVGEDVRLTELATLEARLRRVEHGGSPSYDRTIWLPGAGAPVLIVWNSAVAMGGVRTGAAVSGDRVRDFVGAVVGPIVTGRGFDVALLDRSGARLWGATAEAASQSVPLETVPGWRISFTAPVPQDGRRVLRYATVLLPAVALMVGLLMTVATVRRELAWARLRSTFVASVTHEFKSPITSIRLLIERLSSGRLAAGDPPARYLAAVDAEAARLEGLVNRLLESQQIQSGKKVYAFEPTSVAALVRKAVDRWRPQADAKRIRLVVSTPEVLDATVDQDAIADLVGNLIDNAIKYSPADTTVTVTLARAGDRFDLDVVDEGAGVDPAEAERIFDPFYRGRRGDRENVHGTGLGLSLVKIAALAHGGSIGVSPNGHRGSRFSLSLPIVPLAPEPLGLSAGTGDDPR